MSESPTFLEEVSNAMPEDSRIVMCSDEFCDEVVVLQADDGSPLYPATDKIWRKLGIVSNVLSVGTPEEMAFRATRKEIAELLPKEGAYAVIEKKAS